MSQELVLASAQLRAQVGDLAGNAGQIIAAANAAAERGAALVLTPELSVLGYPPEDLVLRPSVVAASARALDHIARATAQAKIGIIVGAPIAENGKLYNAAVLIEGGRVIGATYKVDLPNYGVFDEKRVFSPGPAPVPLDWRGYKLGVAICEDFWNRGPAEALAAGGAEFLMAPNGSPYRRTIETERLAAMRPRVVETALPFIFVNRVGGQDDLAFDGRSFSLDQTGAIVQQLPAFAEKLSLATWRRGPKGWACVTAERAEPEAAAALDYAAMMQAVGDYVDANGFPGVLLGLSGGVDSALTAAIAVDALGAERVWAVMLPFRYTSSDSLADARLIAKTLGVRYDEIGIDPAMRGFLDMLSGPFAGLEADVTEENLQSRARGVTLMALSNKFGALLLTTGNKSEIATGYATLYGDMSGGYNPIKDLYKTEVYAIARWRNAQIPRGGAGPAGIVIPERVLSRAPSAELRPNQTDQDSLPPYDMLDAILRGLIERDESVDIIAAQGFDRAVVARVERLLHLSEYKRRQAAPGVKLGARAFGRDRRYPISHKWREG